jgi:hypothetical protein
MTLPLLQRLLLRLSNAAPRQPQLDTATPTTRLFSAHCSPGSRITAKDVMSVIVEAFQAKSQFFSWDIAVSTINKREWDVA